MAQSLAVRAAMSLPMVAWAILTGFLLFGKGEPGMAQLSKGCPEKAAYSWRSNIPALDQGLCTLVNFFVRAQSSDEGKWVTGYIGTLLVSVLAFMAVEGSRVKSGWFLSATWIHAIILQMIGVSVSFPLLWLPIYFLSDGANRDPHQIWKKKISLPRVSAIAVAFLLLWLNIIALFFPLRTDQKQLACLIFQAMPLVVTFVYLPFTTANDAPQQKGHKGVIALHLLQAGFGLTWHLVGILYVIRDPDLPSRVLHLFTSFRPEEFSVYFLLIDVVSLFLSFLYLTALEDGILIALLELVGACLFGPAFAVSAYCVFREQSISKAVSGVRSKRKD